MNKKVLLSLIGIIALLTGFFLFLFGYRSVGVGFTITGILVYLLIKTIEKKN